MIRPNGNLPAQNIGHPRLILILAESTALRTVLRAGCGIRVQRARPLPWPVGLCGKMDRIIKDPRRLSAVFPQRSSRENSGNEYRGVSCESAGK